MTAAQSAPDCGPRCASRMKSTTAITAPRFSESDTMRFMSKGALALLGSGETAPGMTKVHRQLFKRLSEVRAVNLDTAYGSKKNPPKMPKKLLTFSQPPLPVPFDPLPPSPYKQSSKL